MPEPSSIYSIKSTQLVAVRIEEQTPRAYRLGRRNGELVLQGAFFWSQGWEKGGHEWRDIPIVGLDDEVDPGAAAQRGGA